MADLKLHPGWKGATDQNDSSVDGGGGGSDNDPMGHRVTVLETRLDTILPTLATKTDIGDTKTAISEAKADIVKWVVGTALAGIALALTVMTFVLNNASPKAPAPPPVVIYSTPSGHVVPAVPAPQPGK